MEWSGQRYPVVIDTGSSNTWLVQEKFRCVDRFYRRPLHPDSCGYSAGWRNDSTFRPIPGEDFTTLYADGTYGTGILGLENVTLCGVEVQDQVVGLVNSTAWFGEHDAAGVLGMGLPALASPFHNSSLYTDASGGTVNRHHIPIFTNMVQRGLVEPVFSLALRRNGTGHLALGGIPPIAYNHPVASTDILYASPLRRVRRELTDYTIEVQIVVEPPPTMLAQSEPPANITIDIPSLDHPSTDHHHRHRSAAKTSLTEPSPPFRALVDSGTTALALPAPVADAVARLFDPPAAPYHAGAYAVKCTAVPPRVYVRIGGIDFSVAAEDLVHRHRGGGTGCFAGLGRWEGWGGVDGILGDVFLRNVLAVFDVGGGKMWFASRED